MEHEAEVEGIGVGVDDEGTSVPAVIVAARAEMLPIFVTGDQARSIELALSGEPAERPLTHDLLVNVVTELGGAIDKVRVDDLTDGTFYAKVDLVRYDDGESETFVFDIRPSDGIALAARVECPISVTDEVLDQAGQDPSERTTEQGSDPDESSQEPGADLQDLLEEFEEDDRGGDR